MSNNRLFKLRHLVEELTDRDQKIKEDLSLFESVFESFPVPVAFWSVDAQGNVFSKKLSCGSSWGVINKDADCLATFYKCPLLQQDMDKYWKIVAQGKPCSFMSTSTGGPLGDIYIWTRLIPRISNDEIVGMTALCWDVSSNHFMLESLKNIKELSKDDMTLEKIHNNAVEAIEKSRLDKLIKAGGK
jgi:hypothetical protein